jgi:hypothetical protein
MQRTPEDPYDRKIVFPFAESLKFLPIVFPAIVIITPLDEGFATLIITRLEASAKKRVFPSEDIAKASAFDVTNEVTEVGKLKVVIL